MTREAKNVTVVTDVVDGDGLRIERQVLDGRAKFVVIEPHNPNGAPWVACYASTCTVKLAVETITPGMARAVAEALLAAMDWLDLQRHCRHQERAAGGLQG